MDIQNTLKGVADNMIQEPGPKGEPPPEPKPGEPQPQPTPPAKEPAPPPKKSDEPPPGPPPIPDTLLKKPDDKKDDDDFDPNAVKLEELDEKVRPNFAKMRDKLNGVTKEYEALQAKAAELEKKLEAAPGDETEAAKKWQEEKTQLLDTIGKLNLEADPRFVAKYDAQTNPITENLKSTLESYNVEDLNAEEVIAFAAQIGAKDRIDFLASQLPEELQQAAVATLIPMFSQLDMIENARDAELNQHEAVLQQMNTETVSQSQAAFDQLKAEKREEAVTSLAEEEILLQKVEGNDAWNESVEALNKKIEAVFATDDPAVHAKALAASALVPMYKEMFFAERAQRVHLEEVLKDRNIAIPKVDAKAPQTPAKKQVSGSMSVDDAVAAVAGSTKAYG
jgi:hypothetical protein